MNIEGIQIIDKPIALSALRSMAHPDFGNMIKGVIDIERKRMALGGELHADEEAVLLEDGSNQQDLWGINIYFDRIIPDMVEFDSMINLRPNHGNRSRSVEDEGIRAKILQIVAELINIS